MTIKLPPEARRARKPSAGRGRRYEQQAAKDRFLELIGSGLNIQPALDKVGRTRKTYEEWRRNDEHFKAKVDQLRALRGKRSDVERGERLGFAEWRWKYLKVSTPWHQLQWVDMIEGKTPRDLHPSQVYTKGTSSNRILINCPPFHPLAVDTPILTTEGWSTVGEVQVGDEVYDSIGRPTRVADTWESVEEDLYEVEFSTGDVVTVDGRHQWYVERPDGTAFERATLDLLYDLRYRNGAAKWRVPVMEPAKGVERDLPLDPYILGYWLGDGCTGKSEIAVSDSDLPDLLGHLHAAGWATTVHAQRGGHSVYVRGMRAALRDAGVMNRKHIPAAYASASRDQRQALLQGLMDSDGTITAKDGRASFAQNHELRPELVRDTYRLVASLGYQPRLRDESQWAISPGTGEKYWNAQQRIYFTPGADRPVFRLARKADRQKATKPRTGFRRIVDIRSSGRGAVKCLTVLAPGSLYAVGDGCIVNRNGKSIALTVDYSVYRLCMNPAYRILIISAGADLAGQFLYGIKDRLTSPDFVELQKAYAPEGGWENSAESWTDSRIIFGTNVRAEGTGETHEKDPNVQIVGMGSKIYGRRADLIFVDDGVDETNVSAYAKQAAWLSRTVLSRLELGGKLVMVGTRVAPIDLYSHLMKPESYANQRVPWTYLASPAILEEGKTPEEHVTLWPAADMPWVPRDPSGTLLDSCICGRDECSDGYVDNNGDRKFARWDGLHLEMGPRADNSATMWALVYQQRSVGENATFPEHAVQNSTTGLRLCGRLENNMSGHPLGGMHGKYVIAGLDPSIKGFAGMVVAAIDRETGKRYVLNAWNLRAPTSDRLMDKMKEVTELYGVNEWRVEKTGLLQFFTQQSALRSWFSTRGVRFTEHLTGGHNKWDAAFGVSSLAALFGEYDKSWDNPNGEWREITPPLIDLPRGNTDGMKALVHQLITWTPELDPAKVPCDMVMALWFLEIGAREALGVGGGGNITVFGRSNKFVSPRARKASQAISLADYRG